MCVGEGASVCVGERSEVGWTWFFDNFSRGGITFWPEKEMGCADKF